MSAAVATVLRRARALIETPERWCQGVNARATTGSQVGATNPEAVARCGVAALVCGAQGISGAYYGARDALCRAVRADYFSDWQDNPKRTHAEVLAAFDRAIASEEAS